MPSRIVRVGELDMKHEGCSITERMYDLDELGRLVGRLYDQALRMKGCEHDCRLKREDGCHCSDMYRDLADMVWEAKAGKPERLDAFMAAAMAWRDGA